MKEEKGSFGCVHPVMASGCTKLVPDHPYPLVPTNAGHSYCPPGEVLWRETKVRFEGGGEEEWEGKGEETDQNISKNQNHLQLSPHLSEHFGTH